MYKFDKNLERELVFINMEPREGWRGDHSPQNYKIIFVKDIPDHSVLLFKII